MVDKLEVEQIEEKKVMPHVPTSLRIGPFGFSKYVIKMKNKAKELVKKRAKA